MKQFLLLMALLSSSAHIAAMDPSEPYGGGSWDNFKGYDAMTTSTSSSDKDTSSSSSSSSSDKDTTSSSSSEKDTADKK